MGLEVVVEQQSARPLLVVRRLARPTDLPIVVPEACGVVWDAVRRLEIPGAGRHVAVYLDDQINAEIGVELEVPFNSTEEVFASATPAGMVATTTFVGPYRRLYEAHIAIREYCVANGYRLAGPRWEVYDHWQEEWNSNPSLATTHVCHLLDLPAPPGETIA